EFLNDPAANRAVVEMFAREGADSWYKHSAEEILPAGVKCAKCGGTKFRKEMDIIDVWFESGSSHAAVLGREPGLPWPADLYLEGGDQHRGWFHSSLLCAVATKGAAPYRGVATAGWTLDPQGRAMSKSLGNTVDPVEIADKLGAEIVRLWVASVDFREDVMASDELMQRVAESYRKIRNTFRYILGNLQDFAPAQDAVGFAEMHPLDQYILLRAAEVTKDVREHYDNFVFHRLYHRLKDFCIVDLSRRVQPVLEDVEVNRAQVNDAKIFQSVVEPVEDKIVVVLTHILGDFGGAQQDVLIEWMHLGKTDCVLRRNEILQVAEDVAERITNFAIAFRNTLHQLVGCHDILAEIH